MIWFVVAAGLKIIDSNSLKRHNSVLTQAV